MAQDKTVFIGSGAGFAGDRLDTQLEDLGRRWLRGEPDGVSLAARITTLCLAMLAGCGVLLGAVLLGQGFSMQLGTLVENARVGVAEAASAVWRGSVGRRGPC